MMADLCKQCSVEIYGEDSGDLAGFEDGTMVLCEGCGRWITVDAEGSRKGLIANDPRDPGGRVAGEFEQGKCR